MRIGRRAFLRLAALAAGAGLTARAYDALAEETAVGIHRATRNTLLGALGSGLRRLQTPLPPFKAYAGAARIALGERPAPTRDVPFARACARRMASAAGAGRVLTRDELARLLHLTNGDTGRGDSDPYRLRAAPSAGALYAGELYVVALAVGGLAPGVYYYDVGEHALVTVRAGADTDELAAALPASEPAAGAAALVCISNVFERYQQRYSNRGYRYALIDTGHIGENLALAAASAALAHRALRRFADDGLNALLGIDGTAEAVCAVHAIGGVVPTSAGSATPPLVENGAAGGRIASEAEPTVRYHESTKLVPARRGAPRPARRQGREPSPAPPAPSLAKGETVHLPFSGDVPQAPLERCIAERRSPAAFAREAIAAERLAFVLASAQPAGQRPGAATHVPVELLAVVHRVSGIDAGLYLYLPEERQLVAVRKEDLTDSLPRACLGQSKAGDAAVGVVLAGRLRESAARFGERSYRDLLIEAGEIAERVYLAAQAAGLRARNLAAYLDDDLDELVGLDGRERAVVHLTMLGQAA